MQESVETFVIVTDHESKPAVIGDKLSYYFGAATKLPKSKAESI